jgi:iron complex transport system substrate-binding protein
MAGPCSRQASTSLKRGWITALVLFVLPATLPSEPTHAPEQAESPGLRIVTLAPHLAELLFAVGAGHMLVGVSAYTDYPEATAKLPVIGDAFAVDQERLAMLEPDLLLAWKGGTPANVIDRIAARGYRIETIETRGLQEISTALERIGALTGQQQQAAHVANAFRAALQLLEKQNRGATPVRVFYQVSDRPVYTVNGAHYVSELIDICGGTNVFADLNDLAPLVDVEAVLARNPEVLLASDDNREDAFDVWGRWPEMSANRYGNHFFLPANEMGRATPRLSEAGESLCRTLDLARANRAAWVADRHE